MLSCFHKEDSSETHRKSLDLFSARVGNIDNETRLRLIFKEFQELESDVCRRSKVSRSKSDWFWWFNIIFVVSMIGGAGSVTIVEAFTEQKNIPVIVIGAVMVFIGTIHQFLRLSDRGFTYRHGNYRLQRIRQDIRDVVYRFQNYTAEQLLVNISEIRKKIDETDMELYRANMTGNVKFDSDLGIELLNTVQPSTSEPEVRPSEIHIHLDSQHSSTENTPKTTPRQSPYFQRHVQRLHTESDSEVVKSRQNSLKVAQRKEEYSVPVMMVADSSDSL